MRNFGEKNVTFPGKKSVEIFFVVGFRQQWQNSTFLKGFFKGFFLKKSLQKNEIPFKKSFKNKRKLILKNPLKDGKSFLKIPLNGGNSF